MKKTKRKLSPGLARWNAMRARKAAAKGKKKSRRSKPKKRRSTASAVTAVTSTLNALPPFDNERGRRKAKRKFLRKVDRWVKKAETQRGGRPGRSNIEDV